METISGSYQELENGDFVGLVTLNGRETVVINQSYHEIVETRFVDETRSLFRFICAHIGIWKASLKLWVKTAAGTEIFISDDGLNQLAEGGIDYDAWDAHIFYRIDIVMKAKKLAAKKSLREVSAMGQQEP